MLLNDWPYWALALVSVALVCLTWYYVPRVMARHAAAATFGKEDRVRVALSGLVTTIAVVVGVFVTVYQFQVNQRAQLDSQVTTVLLESIKLLGGKDTDGPGKAGAIYAMRGPMEYGLSFHDGVIRTLVSFVRGQRSKVAHPTCDLKRVNDVPEIQAALDVIGGRSNFRPEEAGGLLDFSQLCLLGATFNQLHYENADFHESDLRRTSFEGAYVGGANFSAASMDYWRAPDVDPEEKTPAGLKALEPQRPWQILTLFRGARAKGAIFNGACLRGVDFSGAELGGATFADAGVSLANFTKTVGFDVAELKTACAPIPILAPAGLDVPTCAREPKSAASAEPAALEQCEIPLFRVLGDPSQ